MDYALQRFSRIENDDMSNPIGQLSLLTEMGMASQSVFQPALEARACCPTNTSTRRTHAHSVFGSLAQLTFPRWGR